jgi:hypothetical protein
MVKSNRSYTRNRSLLGKDSNMFLRLIEATNWLPPVNDLVSINIQLITTRVMGLTLPHTTILYDGYARN